MRPVLYLDILLVLNFIIDYILLCGTRAISDTCTKKWRVLVASAVASLSSLIILAPVLPLAVQFLYKALTAALIIFVAFPYQTMRQYLKQLLWFLLLSITLAGAVLFFMFSFSLSGVQVNNMYVYFHVSPITLVVSVLAVYLTVQVLLFFFGRNAAKQGLSIKVQLDDTFQFDLYALYDTGFFVKDSMSGSDVILVDYNRIKSQLPSSLCKAVESFFAGCIPPACAYKLRLIPYNTVQGQGVFPAFFCKSITLTHDEKTIQHTKVLLAFTKEPITDGYTAIVGGELANAIL